MDYPYEKHGYLYRKENVDGKRKTIYAHREIYAQHYNIPEGYVVHHIDEDASNNDISNLVAMSIGEHISLHHTGKIMSEEARRNMSIAATGKIMSEEARRNNSIAQTGRIVSEETREKITGLKHHKAFSISIQHEDGRTDTGCCSELARRHNFQQSSMSAHGKSKGWIILSNTNNQGEIKCIF